MHLLLLPGISVTKLV